MVACGRGRQANNQAKQQSSHHRRGCMRRSQVLRVSRNKRISRHASAKRRKRRHVSMRNHQAGLFMCGAGWPRGARKWRRHALYLHHAHVARMAINEHGNHALIAASKCCGAQHHKASSRHRDSPRIKAASRITRNSRAHSAHIANHHRALLARLGLRAAARLRTIKLHRCYAYRTSRAHLTRTLCTAPRAAGASSRTPRIAASKRNEETSRLAFAENNLLHASCSCARCAAASWRSMYLCHHREHLQKIAHDARPQSGLVATMARTIFQHHALRGSAYAHQVKQWAAHQNQSRAA